MHNMNPFPMKNSRLNLTNIMKRYILLTGIAMLAVCCGKQSNLSENEAVGAREFPAVKSGKSISKEGVLYAGKRTLRVNDNDIQLNPQYAAAVLYLGETGDKGSLLIQYQGIPDAYKTTCSGDDTVEWFEAFIEDIPIAADEEGYRIADCAGKTTLKYTLTGFDTKEDREIVLDYTLSGVYGKGDKNGITFNTRILDKDVSLRLDDFSDDKDAKSPDAKILYVTVDYYHNYIFSFTNQTGSGITLTLTYAGVDRPDVKTLSDGESCELIPVFVEPGSSICVQTADGREARYDNPENNEKYEGLSPSVSIRKELVSWGGEITVLSRKVCHFVIADL